MFLFFLKYLVHVVSAPDITFLGRSYIPWYIHEAHVRAHRQWYQTGLCLECRGSTLQKGPEIQKNQGKVHDPTTLD